MLVGASLSSADWVSLGPPGAVIGCGATSAGSPPVLYVYDAPNMLKSFDGGANWTVTQGTLPGVLGAAVDPLDSNTVVCATTGGCYRSSDGCETWNHYSMGSLGGSGLAMNPQNARTLYSSGYASGPGGWMLYCGRSTDGGVTWTQVECDTTGAPSGGAVAIDPIDTTVVYVGDLMRANGHTHAGFYKSTDCAQTWTRLEIDPNAQNVNSIHVSPLDHNVLVVGTAYAVYRSTDGGQTWTATGSSGMNSQMVCVPDEPSVLYTTNGTDVFRSPDTGNTWVATGPVIAGKSAGTLLTQRGDSSTVYLGNFCGMFKSIDHGDHWQMINNGIPRTGGMPIAAAAPNGRPDVCVQTSEDAIYRSTDEGDHWECQPRVPGCASLCAFVYDAVDPQRMWMLTGRG